MKIIAITACPMGVAHTHMAAAALERKAKQLGHEIRIEKQGATGTENKITDEEVATADVMIMAVDTAINGKERFANIKTVYCSVGEALRKTDKIFKEIEELF